MRNPRRDGSTCLIAFTLDPSHPTPIGERKGSARRLSTVNSRAEKALLPSDAVLRGVSGEGNRGEANSDSPRLHSRSNRFKLG